MEGFTRMIPISLLREMYKTMLSIRLFEERVADLLEADAIQTPCHLYIGEEAIATGVCSALERDDFVWGGHRSHGHYIAKGGGLKALMAEICGKSTGCCKGRGGSMHVVAPDVGVMGTVPIVAATIPIAVGAGLASKLRRNGRVSVAFFGDGATEEGHFHESLNMAALLKLPVVFVCENNFYSSHLHISQRRPLDNIASIGDLYGISSMRLDGNDVSAVYQSSVEAVERARKGLGPSLLECRTYRWRGHVGPSWDMDVGVKRSDELQEWLLKDPIKRVKEVLVGRGISDNELDEDCRRVRAEVEDSLRFSDDSQFPNRDDLADGVFVPNGE